jgi:hypothetical protein
MTESLMLVQPSTDPLRDEWSSFLRKVDTARALLEAKNASHADLINYSALTLVAGEELVEMLNTLRQRIRETPGFEDVLAKLPDGSKVLAAVDSMLQRHGSSPAVQALSTLVRRADREARSGAATNAATARHRKSPQGAAKSFVHECWAAWREHPRQFRSKAAFARAMLDKFPDTLASSQVIEGWVRAWDGAPK